MGASIVDIQNMGDALRNTGYKNIESAVAEIIDNSVEANAKNIFLILREGIATSGRKVVTEIKSVLLTELIFNIKQNLIKNIQI